MEVVIYSPELDAVAVMSEHMFECDPVTSEILFVPTEEQDHETPACLWHDWILLGCLND